MRQLGDATELQQVGRTVKCAEVIQMRGRNAMKMAQLGIGYAGVWMIHVRRVQSKRSVGSDGGKRLLELRELILYKRAHRISSQQTRYWWDIMRTGQGTLVREHAQGSHPSSELVHKLFFATL